MPPSDMRTVAWIAVGTTYLTACSPETPNTGPDAGPNAGPPGDTSSSPPTEPLRPSCRLELETRGRPERVLVGKFGGTRALLAATRGAPKAGGGAVGTLHAWVDPFLPPHVVELPDYLLGPEPLGSGVVVASRATSELIHLDPLTGEILWREVLDDVPRALGTGILADGREGLAIVNRAGELALRIEGSWRRSDAEILLATTLLVESDAIWVGSQADQMLRRFAPEDLTLEQAIQLDGIPRCIGRFDLGGRSELCVAGGDRALWTIEDGEAMAVRVGSIPIGLAPAEGGVAVLGHGDLAYGVFDDGERLHGAYAGQDPWDLASGDIDGDGRLDLAFANRGAKRVSVLLGDGAGRFLEARQLSVGRSPHHLTSMDVDGDGRAELITLDALEDALVVLDVEQGERSSSEVHGIVHGLIAGDVDGQPGEEVLLSIEAGTTGRLEVWRPVETAPGSFVLERTSTLALPGRPGDLARMPDGSGVGVADLAGGLWLVRWGSEGPGDPTRLALPGIPVAVAPVGDSLGVALGPPGDFHAIVFVRGGALDPDAELDLAGIPPLDLVAYDHDGDGATELALLLEAHGENGPGRLALLRQQGEQWRPWHSESTGLRAFAIAAGDLNGDLCDELVVGAQNSHHINLWTPTAEGLHRLPDLGVGRGVLDVEIVDVAGDGKRAVVGANNFSGDLSVVWMRD